jgi:hypothetical protein
VGSEMCIRDSLYLGRHGLMVFKYDLTTPLIF